MHVVYVFVSSGHGGVLPWKRGRLRETCGQPELRRPLHHLHLLPQQELGRQGVFRDRYRLCLKEFKVICDYRLIVRLPVRRGSEASDFNLFVKHVVWKCLSRPDLIKSEEEITTDLFYQS